MPSFLTSRTAVGAPETLRPSLCLILSVTEPKSENGKKLFSNVRGQLPVRHAVRVRQGD